MKKSDKNELDQKDRLYNCPIPIIGITGGIASGKTTVSKYIELKNHHVIYADEIIKEIYLMQEAVTFIQNLVPDSVINNNIDFKKLREVFFQNDDIKKKVENFLYPQMKRVFDLKLPIQKDYLFYEVPLLFEKHLENHIDVIVTVYCSSRQQITRLCKRDNIDEDFSKKIIQSQFPIDKKRANGHYVIQNNNDKDSLAAETDRVLGMIESSLKEHS